MYYLRRKVTCVDGCWGPQAALVNKARAKGKVVNVLCKWPPVSDLGAEG